MNLNDDIPFDTQRLFDLDASDPLLSEQLIAFFREGYTGSELTTLIMYNYKPGIAQHVSRLMVILKEIKDKI